MKRFVAFPLVRMVGEAVVFIAAATAYASAARALHVPNVVSIWITLALLIAVVLLVERYTVGAGARDVGFDPRHAVRDVLLGCAIGAALFSAVVLELFVAGSYRISGVHPSWQLLALALVLVPGAAIEEVLFRGIVFRLIAQWTGTWVGIAVSAAIFGGVHALNPGATWFSTLAIALEAGVLLAAAFVATGNLWLPIGMHFAWNFFEGPIYGTDISGRAMARPLLDGHLSGAAALTGGPFGPEAGVPALVTALVVAVAFLAYAQRKEKLV